MLMRGTVLNTEGELDGCDAEAMLQMGEQIGLGWFEEFTNDDIAEVVIAADSLEGTALCAEGANNAMCTAAISERGGILAAPELYMEKIVVGPACADKIDPEAPRAQILQQMSLALSRDMSELNIIVLGRPRHESLIWEIRNAGAEVTIIPHGDLTAGILAAFAGTGVHGLMGTGGSPEGVLTAAAMEILGGRIFGKFVPKTALQGSDRDGIPDDVAGRLREFGILDPSKFLTNEDLVPGQEIAFGFAAVTNSELLRGVREFGHGGHRVNSCLMLRKGNERIVRWSDVTETTDPEHVFRRERA
jgi:fructose-1,6-bisphosphatase/sedoheptulose 1,7-bisphosphatase-like protein